MFYPLFLCFGLSGWGVLYPAFLYVLGWPVGVYHPHFYVLGWLVGVYHSLFLCFTGVETNAHPWRVEMCKGW